MLVWPLARYICTTRQPIFEAPRVAHSLASCRRSPLVQQRYLLAPRWVPEMWSSLGSKALKQHRLPRLRAVHCTAVEEDAAVKEEWGRQLSNKPLTVVGGREWLRQTLPVEALRVAGVTFDGRQELIASLLPDQAVMLEKELDNPYDPNAIAIKTLSGTSLGYVPRDLTHHFPYDVAFGHVHHIGQVPDNGNWGALVAVRPQLPPLTVDAIPDSLQCYVNLSSILAKDDWDKLSQALFRAASYRCEISMGSGSDSACPVVCQEVWAVDDEQGVVKLMGLQALAPEVHLAKHVTVIVDEKQRQTAMWALQAMNEWSIMEAEAYLNYVESLIQKRNKRSWVLDLSWLGAKSIQIPEVLREVSL